METLDLGWEFPVVIALTAMLLFFSGCLFITGLYITALSFQRKFPVRAAVLFWIAVATCALSTYVMGVEEGAIMFMAASPLLAAVFWFYERKQRHATGDSGFFIQQN